jgi:hypothetical protein
MKTENLLVRTKFYWSCAGGPVHIVRTVDCQLQEYIHIAKYFGDEITYLFGVTLMIFRPFPQRTSIMFQF